jgi:hypothetical protein
MTLNTPARLVCGTGGALMLVSLFLNWASVGELDRSGWELWTMADVFFLIAGLVAIGAAVTGGRFGLFRPDLSLSGAADLLGLVATVLIAWLLLLDFPDGASPGIGAFVALIAAVAIAGGAGDYRTFRGAPLFPRLADDEPRAP